VVDTPGLRELQLWAEEEGLEAAFGDVSALAARCRFADCRHEVEPDCAVRGALESGGLSRERYASYRKLEKELAHLERQRDQRKQLEQKARWKAIHRALRRKAPRE
jgi:ribosome biogenesis GTPase